MYRSSSCFSGLGVSIENSEWQSVQLAEKQNEQLLDLSKQILELTDAIHSLTVEHTGGPGPAMSVEKTPSPT